MAQEPVVNDAQVDEGDVADSKFDSVDESDQVMAWSKQTMLRLFYGDENKDASDDIIDDVQNEGIRGNEASDDPVCNRMEATMNMSQTVMDLMLVRPQV
ncbi:hypothetical protein PsorP6_009560 [Peronosclerospora sorghi]|uniref:Uncharacterized protein n=1 Tax=Peronosclerospora sorghi TaxID=230839 RepID=A0ACC0VY00_9STRA|nr:hypothetical protein PsorP6_009560 [Peronosclerospora sorghi]